MCAKRSIHFSEMESLSYRELQKLAKRMSLPANGKREVLEKRIRVRQSLDGGDVAQAPREGWCEWKLGNVASQTVAEDVETDGAQSADEKEPGGGGPGDKVPTRLALAEPVRPNAHLLNCT